MARRMKRLAVFRGDVSMGGRIYQEGEEIYMRTRDVQALLDTGVMRWADEEAKPAQSAKPNIWALDVKTAKSAIRLEKSPGRLKRWHKEERENPKGARKGVLNAIEEQLGQLGVSDPMPTLAR